MKSCPKCKIKVGGNAECCPLCQNTLVGTDEMPYWPATEPPGRRISLLYKILAFGMLAGCIICVTVDLLAQESNFHWSAIVVVCTLAVLGMLRYALRRYQGVPRLLFQILLTASVVLYLCDRMTGYSGFSVRWVIPILCMATLTANFILSFIRGPFAENGLVYLLLNILIGFVCCIMLLCTRHMLPLIWVVCLLFSLITLLGLAVFQGRTLAAELHKRLHL